MLLNRNGSVAIELCFVLRIIAAGQRSTDLQSLGSTKYSSRGIFCIKTDIAHAASGAWQLIVLSVANLKRRST